MDDLIWKKLYLGTALIAGTISFITLVVWLHWRRAIIVVLLIAIIAIDIYWWVLATGEGDASQWQIRLIDSLYILAFLIAIAFIAVKEAKSRLLGSMLAFGVSLIFALIYWIVIPHIDPGVVDKVAVIWELDRSKIVQNHYWCISIWLVALLVMTRVLYRKHREDILFPTNTNDELKDIPSGLAWAAYSTYLLFYLFSVSVFGDIFFGV